MKRQRGVSLTEMLVCLVIIAIVVGLLSPVFTKAKASAKQVGDVSNMRQIYAALQLYKADHEGYPLRSTPEVLVKGYLGGTALRCKTGEQPDYDYRIYGVHDILLRIGLKPAFEQYEACRVKREGEWPLLQDTNHMSERMKVKTGSSFLRLIRESGKLEQIDVSKLYSDLSIDRISSFPCPESANSFLDINY